MWKRNHSDCASGDETTEPAADQFLEPGLAQEPLDCQLADRNQYGGPDQCEFVLKPRRTARYLLPAWLQVSPLAAARKALHHRSHVAERSELLLLKAGLFQPPEQPPSGSAGKRLAKLDLFLARRLPDQHPAWRVEAPEHGADSTRQATPATTAHPRGENREA